MSTSNELRVFISSTFRDLQEEREHLVKKIFPEIRALCRHRGVAFTDIDLRWGITEEEAEREGIIRICLDEIDRCRPYFIGILGERYGWVPPASSIQTIGDGFPNIAASLEDGTSITEMEMIYGVLANPTMAGRAFFYMRDPSATPHGSAETEDSAIHRLRRLKDRIRASGFPVRENFTSPAQLGEWLERDIRAVLDAEYPESSVPDPLELNRRRHSAFARSRTSAYVSIDEHLRTFETWRVQGSKPLVVRGDSGLGKSSLVAFLAAEYRRIHPTALIIEHYVGATNESGSALAVMQHAIEEIRGRFNIDESVPATEEQLTRSFPNWLFRAERLAADAGVNVLLVIDALNQLGPTDRGLAWLPKTMPSGIKVIVSTTPGETEDRLVVRDWEELVLTPIDSIDVRHQIVLRYLGDFHKGLSSARMDRVVNEAKGASPLFLRVVAEELRVHGEHESLDEAIDRYLSADDLPDVFDRVLERLERDYGADLVCNLMSLTWASRAGLSEAAIIDLIGCSRLDLSRLLFAIDYHFVRRDGVLGFFHDYLRRAVEKRYLSDPLQIPRLRSDLARYFEGLPISETTALELLWQYGADDVVTTGPSRDERLASTLARTDVLLLLFRDQTRFEMLEWWTLLGRRGFDVEQEYRRSLAGHVDNNRSAIVTAAATLLASLTRWDIAGELYAELLELATSGASLEDEFRGHVGLGQIAQHRGNYTEAIEHFDHALQLAIEVGDTTGIADAIGSRGAVQFLQGLMTESIESHRRQLEIAEEMGDRRRIASAIGSIGIAVAAQGGYAEAMEHFERQLSICDELGDRAGIVTASGNVGNVLYSQGRFTDALEFCRRQLLVSEELGDRRVATYALGNVGYIYYNLGQYGEAMTCYRRQLAISEEIGDRAGIARALSNIGWIHADQGRNDEAIRCYERQLAVSIELGDRDQTSRAIGAMGAVHVAEGRYEEALDCFERQLATCTDMGNRNGMSSAMTNIGIVLFQVGRYGESMKYQQMSTEISNEIGDDVSAAVGVGNMGSLNSAMGDYDRALDCFFRASETHRSTGYLRGLTFWLEGIARAMIDIEHSNGSMPEYLPRHLDGITEETWRSVALRKARECSEECIAISADLSKPDTLFGGKILLARITAAEGGRRAASTTLASMLADPADGDNSHERTAHRAEIHYWLWRIGAEPPMNRDEHEHHRAEALRLLKELVVKTPKHEYHERIEELQHTPDQSH